MYRRHERKWGTIILVSLLGLSNVGLATNLITKSKFPAMNIPVGPYTSYRVVANKNGYTISYKANDPKKFKAHKRSSTPKGVFGGKTEEIDLYEEHTFLDTPSSKDGEGITDEMIACIKTQGAGESTGRLIGTSIGTQAAPAVSQIPIVGWLAAGWIAMFGGNKGAEVGGDIATSFNDC